MEQIKNFDDFYEVKLQPFLASLKEQDNKSYYWGIFAVVTVLLIVPVLAFGLSKETDGYGGLMILITVVLAVVSVYNHTKAKENYESNYKEQVIRQIINFIHPGLDYKPDICVSHKDYVHSSLCRAWYDDYDGDDWIGGIYKNVNFKCSELNVSRRMGSRNSGRIVYRGLFFAAPLNVAFSGGTYVWLKENLQLPASIADERYRLLPMPEVVRVDCCNGDFEKHYAVYSTDVYEASALINQQMMSDIVNFRKQIGRDITLSFVAGVCYVAIPFEESLFEPQSGSSADKEEIKKYFFAVLLILGIINQLQLDKM